MQRFFSQLGRYQRRSNTTEKTHFDGTNLLVRGPAEVAVGLVSAVVDGVSEVCRDVLESLERARERDTSADES